MALNTFADARDPEPWFRAADKAVSLGADALIVADTAVMAWCRRQHPQLRLHLSVQTSATSHAAIDFYRQRYGVQRAVLPRVLTLDQVAQLIQGVAGGHRGLRLRQPVRDGGGPLRAVVVGDRAVAQHGRRLLAGVGRALDRNRRRRCRRAAGRCADRPLQRPAKARGYPTLCKGRFDVDGQRSNTRWKNPPA
jgi:collagenase-like PrtC family protease